jgi:site-specific DNA recombinase
MTRTKRSTTPDLNLSALPMALYARLSSNPDGTKDSVATQIRQGTKFINARWPGREIRVFSDDGINASDDTVYRPDYERMLEAIANGEVGGVTTRWQARISRTGGIWNRYKRVCRKAGIGELHTWLEGDIGLAPGRAVAGDVTNLLNEHQIDVLRLAVADANDERFETGRPSGGRPYGYVHKRDEAGVSHLVVVPEQARVIRMAVAMLIAGSSLSDVARELNNEKVPTPRGGKKWETNTVRNIVTKETVAGIRVAGNYEVWEEVVNGQPKRRRKLISKDLNEDGTWEAILTRAEWLAVRSIFESERTIVRSDGRVTKRKPGRRPARAYLLTGGPIVCGRCATEMIAALHTPKKGDKKPMYLCHSRNGGCNGIGIFAVATEAYVEAVLLDWLHNDTNLEKLLAAADDDAQRRDQIEGEKAVLNARIDQAADDAADAVISNSMANKIEAKCKAKLAKLAAEEMALTTPVQGVDHNYVRENWHRMDLAEKREVLANLQCSVEVAPASGPRRFNPGRLTVSFMGKVWSLPGWEWDAAAAA